MSGLRQTPDIFRDFEKELVVSARRFELRTEYKTVSNQRKDFVYCFLQLFVMNFSCKVDWGLAIDRIPASRIRRAVKLGFKAYFSCSIVSRVTN